MKRLRIYSIISIHFCFSLCFAQISSDSSRLYFERNSIKLTAATKGKLEKMLKSIRYNIVQAKVKGCHILLSDNSCTEERKKDSLIAYKRYKEITKFIKSLKYSNPPLVFCNEDSQIYGIRCGDEKNMILPYVYFEVDCLK